MCDSKIITLDVGGCQYKTRKNTLLSSMFFRTMFENGFQESSSNADLFIDGDGESFRWILFYLRHGKVFIPSREVASRVQVAADFFLLEKLSTALRDFLRTEIEIEVLDTTMQQRSPDWKLVGSFEKKTLMYCCPRGIQVHYSNRDCGRQCANAGQGSYTDHSDTYGLFVRESIQIKRTSK